MDIVIDNEWNGMRGWWKRGALRQQIFKIHVAYNNVIIEIFQIVYSCWADNIFRQTIPDFHSSAKAKYFRTPFLELQLHILGISMKMFAIAGCEEI